MKKHKMQKQIDPVMIILALALAVCIFIFSKVTTSSDTVDTTETIELGTQECISQDTEIEIVENDIIYYQEPVVQEWYDGWVTTTVNIRIAPRMTADIIGTFHFDDYVRFTIYDENWLQIMHNGKTAYISADYVTDTSCPYEVYDTPKNHFKSWMPMSAITSKSSDQYKLREVATGGNYGVMTVEERYCVALGTGWGVTVGDYVDLILENGHVIPIIVTDIKANCDTDSTNKITAGNGCISEFIVNKHKLPHAVKCSGSLSNACPEWNSSIVQVKIYDKNYFD